MIYSYLEGHGWEHVLSHRIRPKIKTTSTVGDCCANITSGPDLFASMSSFQVLDFECFYDFDSPQTNPFEPHKLDLTRPTICFIVAPSALTCSPAAFTTQLLLDGRWMLNSTSRDPNAKASHLWAEKILKMTPNKQCLFVNRVLLLHEVASKRGGKSSNSRLSLAEWQQECDRACILGYIIDAMGQKTDSMGELMFAKDVIESVLQRAIEGTFD